MFYNLHLVCRNKMLNIIVEFFSKFYNMFQRHDTAPLYCTAFLFGRQHLLENSLKMHGPMEKDEIQNKLWSLEIIIIIILNN